MRPRLVLAAFLTLACLALAGPAWADGTQTGSVAGTIRDAGGAPLPGAMINAKATASGFSRDTVSGANGTYTLRLLPIGDYAITVSLQGFQKVVATATVDTDKNTLFDVSLKLSTVQEAVVVSAEQPVVDKTQTNSQTTVNQNFTQKLALGRNYQSILQLAPGVTGGANPNVRGALSSNNVFLFDGVDTTDTATGTFGQNYNYEAIQEVAVNTGGYSAEYGRASGAVVSVVTKSGGNDFHGSAKLIMTNDQWNAQNYQTNQVSGASLERVKFDEVQYREVGTLGGPFLRDHLWFFGSFEYAKTTTAQLQTLGGESYQQATTAKIWSAKATWAITNQHTIEASANADPITGFVVDYWTVSAENAALTGQDQGGKVYRGNYQGVFTSAVSAEATFATSKSRIDVLPFQTPGTAPFYVYNGANVATTQIQAPHFDLSKNWYYNGATFTGYVDRPRTQFNLALNYYKQLGTTNNNFKVGFDYQYLKSGASFAYPGDAVYYDDLFNPTTRQFSPNELQVFDPATPSTSTGHIYGVYFLDKLEMGRFFVNAGFRVDKQDGASDIGRTVVDATTFSPRIYFKYDVAGSGKTLFSGGYGRFYQSVIQSFADGYAAIPQQGNFNDYFYNPATGKFEFDSRVDSGGNTTPVNGDLKPSYSDDFTLAFEHQLGRTFGFSVRGTYRTWHNFIDDVRTLSGGVRTIQYTNYDNAKRRYRGLEFVIDKRFSDNWQAYASYTLSRTEGNYFTDFASALGDYLANTTSSGLTGVEVNELNKYGIASYDRTHDIKGYGLYTYPVGIARLSLGTTLGLRSGTTTQMQRTVSLAGQSYTQFVTPRGSDRFPWQFYWDMALQADFMVWKEVGLGIKGEAFNITDTQTQLAGSTSTNPALYMKATSRSQFAGPRNFRLSALITF